MNTEKILNAAANKNLAKEFGNLVFLGNVTEEPYTTDEIVAAYSDNSVHAIKNIIYNHKRDFEEFGVLSFEMTKPNKGTQGGRPTKTYKFNEQQATLLMTYLGNTPKVRAFKKALVKSFFAMRDEKLEQIKNRARSIPERRTLTDAIKNWPYCNKWTYNAIQSVVIGLLDLKQSYQQIKTLLNSMAAGNQPAA